MIKKLIVGVGITLLIILLINFKLLSYILGQAKGQFHILKNARSVEEVLNDPSVVDSVKVKLKLVNEIKQYATDSLGLKQSENYTTVFDQKGEEVLWVVTACNPFDFKAKMWAFPIIGSFTYKGFFDKSKAESLKEKLDDEGLDTEMRSVSGWSTLGWFKDPILTNMLAGSDGELANTVIHELTHGTIFVPDSMTFNENLATFIGHIGSQNFLKATYGENSIQAINYKNKRSDSRKLSQHLIRGAYALDSLYNSFDKNISTEAKYKLKNASITQIIELIDTIRFNNKRYYKLFEKRKPNNAYFISFLNYRERQDIFQEMFEIEFGHNVIRFIDYWKAKYGQ